VNAVLAGDVKVALTTPSDAINAFVAAGKVRMLAVSSAKRSPLLPNVPSISETLPGFAVNAFFGVSAPANTPADVVARVNDAMNKALSEPNVQQHLHGLAMTPSPTTPAAFTEMYRDEYALWVKVARAAGIEPE
jgi:tripartite-type tricarboxylate transporter receptor subunit TctC